MVTWALRLILPSVWFGLLAGLAFIETPLKFLAPGVTLEIALGIGRLVLTTADFLSLGMLLVITLLSICKLTHKESYLNIAAMTIVIPLIALSVVIALGTMFGSF